MSKEKKKGGKKKPAPKESYYEAIVTYKITVKQSELDQANADYNRMFELNRNLKQRNERLNQVKEANLRKVMDQYKTDTKDYRSKQTIDKTHVMEAMREFLAFKQEQEREIINLRKDIKKTDKEISNAKRELQSWINFRDKGQYDLDTKIRLLRKELADMTENYEIMSEYLKKNTIQTVENIVKSTEDKIDNNNKKTVERAFREMEKEVLEMSRDNNWMKEKVELYREEMNVVREACIELENENVKLLKYLFEMSNEELKSVKDAFETQFLDQDNLEMNSIMRVDLDDLDIVRPNSSLKKVMKRINDINMDEHRAAIEYNKLDESESESNLNTTRSVRTLCLKGEKKSIYRPPSLSKEEMEARIFTNGGEWPVTQQMLYEALYSSRRSEPDEKETQDQNKKL